MSVLGLIMSSPPYLRSAMVQFPFQVCPTITVLDSGALLKNRQITYFWILFRFKLVNIARYNNINAVLGLNIISW